MHGDTGLAAAGAVEFATPTPRSGEYIFYRVKLDWGQAYRVHFGQAGGHGIDNRGAWRAGTTARSSWARRSTTCRCRSRSPSPSAASGRAPVYVGGTTATGKPVQTAAAFAAVAAGQSATWPIWLGVGAGAVVLRHPAGSHPPPGLNTTKPPHCHE